MGMGLRVGGLRQVSSKRGSSFPTAACPVQGEAQSGLVFDLLLPLQTTRVGFFTLFAGGFTLNLMCLSVSASICNRFEEIWCCFFSCVYMECCWRNTQETIVVAPSGGRYCAS